MSWRLTLFLTACAVRASSASAETPNLPGLTPNLYAALSAVDLAACPERRSGHRRANTAATTYLKAGEHDKALACYVAALQSKRNFPPALYGIGETFATRLPNAFELAKESYELALKYWPEFVDANIALGDLWAQRGDRARAETYYTAATRLKPNDALSWDSLARSQAADGRIEEALKTYDVAIHRIRDSPGLYFSRGRVYREKGDFEACVQDASRALKAAAEFGQAYHLLAMCSSKLTGASAPSRSDLEAHFRKAIEFEPEFAAHFLDFAWFLYMDSGRLHDARKVLDDAINGLMPEDERVAFEKGAREFEQHVSQKKNEL